MADLTGQLLWRHVQEVQPRPDGADAVRRQPAQVDEKVSWRGSIRAGMVGSAPATVPLYSYVLTWGV